MAIYKQIITTQDWFYVDYYNNQPIIYYIAAWGLTEDDKVYGLVSVPNSQAIEATNLPARLIMVPPSKTGVYKHKNELNLKELDYLNNEKDKV